MTIQYIKDEEGKDQYVVIPYSDYFRMRLALLEYDDEDESDWEDIPYDQISMMTSCCRAKYAT